MIDYEKIESVNKRLCPVDIKGKKYNTVNQRVLAFRELFPDGRITTEMISDEDGRCVFKASAYDGDNVIATGYAFETQADRNSFVNKTSYIENCETSAVGRALAFVGIGATESIASAEEVTNAINKPDKEREEFEKHCEEVKKSKPKDTMIAEVKRKLEETDSDVTAFCKWLGVKSVDEMNMEQYRKAIIALQKKEAK